MDFGSFLATPEIKVKVITYRDIFQDKAMIENRFGGTTGIFLPS